MKMCTYAIMLLYLCYYLDPPLSPPPPFFFQEKERKTHKQTDKNARMRNEEE